MDPNGFNLLRRNLCEICRALHTPEARPGFLPLIASEQTLTYKASWKGRWIQFWSIRPDISKHPLYQIFLKCHSLQVGQQAYQQLSTWAQPWQERIRHLAQNRFVITIVLYLRRMAFPWRIEPTIDVAASYTVTSLFNECVIQKGYKAHHLRVANWVKALSQGKQVDQQDLIARHRGYLKVSFEGLPYLEEYATAFSQLIGQNGHLDERGIMSIRHAVTACSEATQVFWRFFLKSRQTPLTMPLEPFIKGRASVLESKALYRACKNAQRMVDLEGILEEEIPILALSKCNHGMALKEEQELEKWIGKLNACKSKIPLKSFLKVLKEVVAVIQIAGDQSITLDQILIKLDEKGCEFLQQDERNHLIWRQRLRRGSVVVCNGKSFKLGQELGNKIANNAYRVFSLEGHPDWVVKIPRNTLKLKMEAEKIKKEEWHWGVRLVDTIPQIDQDANDSISGLDQGGKCLVIEKLKGSLKNIDWRSSSSILEKEEEEKALVIANHLYVMQDQMAMAEGLSPQHLMFDSRGGLKAIRLLKKGPFNYNELEKFCLSIAKGNAHVTDFIMRVSQLACHPVAEFYRGGVEYVLKYGETNRLSRSLNAQFKRDIYERHLEDLCRQAAELRTSCVSFVRDHLLGLQGYEAIEEQLEQLVYDQLVKVYRSSSTAGTLNAERLMQQVLHHFLDKHKKSPQMGNSQFETYYNEWFQQMKHYNLEALKQK